MHCAGRGAAGPPTVAARLGSIRRGGVQPVTQELPPRPPGPAYVPPPAPIVVEQKSGPGLLVRAVWFVFVGWWLSGIVASIAWFCMITILGLPLGIWLVN